MRKLILMVICLFTLCFSACEDTLPTYMGLTINKLDVKVGEEIDVTGFLHLVILNNQPRYIVHFNGYPLLASGEFNHYESGENRQF